MSVEAELEAIKATLERRGINARGTTDVFGRPFNLPVDEEHKATQLVITDIQNPHQRAFWASTVAFFSTFFSVFAPAALMPYIKKDSADGGIGLTKTQISGSGGAAVGSTIFMRVLAGPMCDRLGARKTYVVLLLLGVPGLIGMFFVHDGGVFIFLRLLIGFSLASFVPCQVWNSQMWTKKIVGMANATAGGWGNLGGGVTQLVMPAIMLGILSGTGGDVGLSWRLCFILPICMHVGSCLAIWTARDLPDGNYKELETSGAKKKGSGAGAAKIGFTNVNAYILVVIYAFCFGTELTMNNKVVLYFHTYFALTPFMSGVFGSMFGMMNLVARSWGGILSDRMMAKYGMRGRIWALFIIQECAGVMCLGLGYLTVNMPGPDDFTNGETVTGVWIDKSEREDVTYYIQDDDGGQVPKCGSEFIDTPMHGLVNISGVMTEQIINVRDEKMMIYDDWSECVQNAAPLGGALGIMILFSIFVQMAEGLTYGIVPYVSRPALGVVSGMVGAGGNLGAVISGMAIISAETPVDEGFVKLGYVTLGCTCTLLFLYFPDAGGMLFGKGGLGGYDPQLVKVDNLDGADQLHYDDVTLPTTNKTSTSVPPQSASQA
jgi:NNP family nitrate/nitrite transporter-like MFS transporter